MDQTRQLADFPWPCDERRAHGRHDVQVQMLTGPDEYSVEVCPGVKAHPLTMAGGSWKP